MLIVANLGLAAWLGGAAGAIGVAVCGSIALELLVGPAGRAHAARGTLPPRLLAAAGMVALAVRR